jgi:hypothetical protein
MARSETVAPTVTSKESSPPLATVANGSYLEANHGTRFRYSSGKDEPLLVHPPLRIVRASFPAYGSSLTKTPIGDPAARPTILWEDIKPLLPI